MPLLWLKSLWGFLPSPQQLGRDCSTRDSSTRAGAWTRASRMTTAMPPTTSRGGKKATWRRISTDQARILTVKCMEARRILRPSSPPRGLFLTRSLVEAQDQVAALGLGLFSSKRRSWTILSVLTSFLTLPKRHRKGRMMKAATEGKMTGIESEERTRVGRIKLSNELQKYVNVNKYCCPFKK